MSCVIVSCHHSGKRQFPGKYKHFVEEFPCTLQWRIQDFPQGWGANLPRVNDRWLTTLSCDNSS